MAGRQGLDGNDFGAIGSIDSVGHKRWSASAHSQGLLDVGGVHFVCSSGGISQLEARELHGTSNKTSALLLVTLECLTPHAKLIQTFFVSAISGSIFSELADIIDNPRKIVSLLADSLPAQSSYFIQLMLVTTLLLQSIEFLRIYQLSCATLRRCFGPRLTEKERGSRWGPLFSLEEPPPFRHARTFAAITIFYVIFFVYAVMTPLTSLFVLLCFVLLESGFRYHLIHNLPPSFDTGGRLWFFFLKFTLASMVVGQLTLVGVLSLRQSSFAVPVTVPLIVITLGWIAFLTGEHFRVAEHLPTRDCVLKDRENADLGVDFLQDEYLQPELKVLTLEPDEPY